MRDESIDRLADGIQRLTLDDGRALVVKRRHCAPPDFFAAEVRGLRALDATRTLRVPAIVASGSGFIAIEDLGVGTPRDQDWRNAGAALAMLHQERCGRFGFDADGWCGDSRQDNTWCDDGHRFFVEHRLAPQLERSLAADRLQADDARRVERVMARLPAIVPAMHASLVHGDLWRGNLHACANGELALIDAAAAHYGWAETDLAMLTLFGEPPRAFFEAYESLAGIDSSWRERAPLYNLYHLLNHLNLFGHGYLASVRAITRRFA